MSATKPASEHEELYPGLPQHSPSAQALQVAHVPDNGTNFYEMLRQVAQGRRARRLCWDNEKIVIFIGDDDVLRIKNTEGRSNILGVNIVDIDALDWVIVS